MQASQWGNHRDNWRANRGPRTARRMRSEEGAKSREQGRKGPKLYHQFARAKDSSPPRRHVAREALRVADRTPPCILISRPASPRGYCLMRRGAIGDRLDGTLGPSFGARVALLFCRMCAML